jgi:hypothetical protein
MRLEVVAVPGSKPSICYGGAFEFHEIDEHWYLSRSLGDIDLLLWELGVYRITSMAFYS